ncbi:hypothetical protein TNCV_3586731 [Trichonephila clavipes]|nr:hypothetical protein TNCV_3586731 [Trichonephila clavipes]
MCWCVDRKKIAVVTLPNLRPLTMNGLPQTTSSGTVDKWSGKTTKLQARPRIRCSRKKQFFLKLNASSGTTAQTSKGSYLGKLPLWPTCPLYHCRYFRYAPEHKKSGCHRIQGSSE